MEMRGVVVIGVPSCAVRMREMLLPNSTPRKTPRTVTLLQGGELLFAPRERQLVRGIQSRDRQVSALVFLGVAQMHIPLCVSVRDMTKAQGYSPWAFPNS